MNPSHVGSGKEWVTPHKVSLAVLVTVFAEKEFNEKCPVAMSPVLVTGSGQNTGTDEESFAPWPAASTGGSDAKESPVEGGGELSASSVRPGATAATGWSVMVSRNFALSMLKWIQVSLSSQLCLNN